jgi:hypothetical protein
MKVFLEKKLLTKQIAKFSHDFSQCILTFDVNYLTWNVFHYFKFKLVRKFLPKKFDVNVLYFELPKVLITKEFQFIKFNIIIIPTVFICTDLHCLCLVFLAINILFLFSNEWKWFALLCFKTCLPWNVKNCSKKKVCLTRLQIDWISKTTFIKNNSGEKKLSLK